MGKMDDNLQSSPRLPRYMVIKNHIIDQVRSGELKPDDKTESENVLANKFGVSRLTVQRAIRELVAEGRLRRVQGSGTFVNSRPNDFPLFEVRDLAEEMRRQGGDPQTDVLIQRQLKPDERVRQLMEIEDDELVFEAVLVRRNGDVPFVLEDRYARRDTFPDFLEHDFSQESIYDYLASSSTLGTLETKMSAIMPYPITCQRLGIQATDPCLHMERRNRMDGRVVTLSRFTFAGSRFHLSSIFEADRFS